MNSHGALSRARTTCAVLTKNLRESMREEPFAALTRRHQRVAWLLQSVRVMLSETEIVGSAIEDRAQALLAVLVETKPLRKRNVHLLRIALRQFLAAEELAGAAGFSLSYETRHQLVELLAGLSPLRDAQVQTVLLKRMHRHKKAVSVLLARASQRRRKFARRASKLIAAVCADTLLRDIRRLRDEVLGTAEDSLASTVTAVMLNSMIRVRYSRLLREKAAISAKHPRTIHRARLSLKEYRYLAEIARAVLPDTMPRDFEAMKRLQDRLGEIHDMGQLAKLARRERAKRSSTISRSLRALAKKLSRVRRQRLQELIVDLGFEPADGKLLAPPSKPPALVARSTEGAAT